MKERERKREREKKREREREQFHFTFDNRLRTSKIIVIELKKRPVYQ